MFSFPHSFQRGRTGHGERDRNLDRRNGGSDREPADGEAAHGPPDGAGEAARVWLPGRKLCGREVLLASDAPYQRGQERPGAGQAVGWACGRWWWYGTERTDRFQGRYYAHPLTRNHKISITFEHNLLMYTPFAISIDVSPMVG